jgi:Rad3-related DNA helicase
MPFSQPNRMLRDLFVHHYGQRADGWLMMNNHAEVLRKIYQGVCRGIRGPNDHCRVYFADARMPPPSVLIDEYPLLYVKPNYKKMLEAIPARFIDDIDNFSVEDL